jgi:sugar phosphate isomerase/epimerase
MGIDFEPILRALKEVGYRGYFTLEANSFLEDYAPENVLDGVEKLKESARRLADRFENL